LKKILFVINGLGLGNASRCKAVIDQLDGERYKIDLLISGRAVDFYQNWKRGEVFYQKALSYPEDGFGLLQTIFSNLKNIVSNILKQDRVLNNKNYDLVVSDSDYIIFLHKILKRFKLVSINNSNIIINNKHLIPTAYYAKVKSQLFFESWDQYLHTKFPDVVICPRLKFGEIEKDNNIRYISPLVRNLKMDREIFESGKGALILSGFDKFDQSKLIARVKEKIPHIDLYIPKSNKPLKIKEVPFKKYEFIISNAGASTISESLFYLVPLLLVPVEGHAEQLVNALIYKKAGFGELSNVSEFEKHLELFLANINKYRKNLEESYTELLNGAEQSRQIIEEIVHGNMC
jgi:uncharacterized protein (TIGR00661 family)